MGKFSLLIVIIGLSFSVSGQQKEIPVQWTVSLNLEEETGKVVMTADIEKGWYIYASSTPEGGPIGTRITFDTPGFDTGNIVTHGDMIVEQSELFDLEVHKFKDRVQFMKLIPDTQVNKINGSITYMCCNSVKCLPPTDIPFEVVLQN